MIAASAACPCVIAVQCWKPHLIRRHSHESILRIWLFPPTWIQIETDHLNTRAGKICIVICPNIPRPKTTAILQSATRPFGIPWIAIAPNVVEQASARDTSSGIGTSRCVEQAPIQRDCFAGTAQATLSQAEYRACFSRPGLRHQTGIA